MVYVDNAQLPYGRMIMCHMVADTPEELRAMAVHIGVHVRWFQRSASAPHFDICKSKRELALQAGAVVVNAGGQSSVSAGDITIEMYG